MLADQTQFFGDEPIQEGEEVEDPLVKKVGEIL